MPGHPVASADTERVGNDIKQVRSVFVRRRCWSVFVLQFMHVFLLACPLHAIHTCIP